MKHHSLISGLAVALLTLGPLPRSSEALPIEGRPLVPEATGAPRPLPIDGYAEALYAEYSSAAENRIAFDLETLDEGAAEDIAGRAFGHWLTVPDHRVIGTLFGTQIQSPHFAEPSAVPTDAGDLRYTMQHYDDLKYPIGMGAYRKLSVTVAIDEESRSHEALELCWRKLSRCVVIDPVVVHAKSLVDNRLRLLSERWGPKLEIHRIEVPTGASGVCRLASHPNWDAVLYRWDAWSAILKDALGTTLVRMNFGPQEAGVRCEGTSAETCRPTPLGSSQPSTCTAADASLSCGCSSTFSFQSSDANATVTARAQCGHGTSTRAGSRVDGEESHPPMTRADGSGGAFADACVWAPAEPSAVAVGTGLDAEGLNTTHPPRAGHRKTGIGWK